MSISPKTNKTLFSQIVAQLPSDSAASFTREQLEILQHACTSLRWKKHPVDVRFTVPFPCKGIYVVFLVGAEQRSHKSRKQRRFERGNYPTEKAAGLILTTTFLCVLAALGIHQLLKLNHPPSEVSPTAIPWVSTEFECQYTGRVWRNGACWDDQWSHMF